MKTLRLLLAVGFLVVLASWAGAQNFDPPKSQPPDEAKLMAIKEKTKKIESKLAALRRKKVLDVHLVEIEVYLKAADWILRHDEFYGDKAVDWTLEILARADCAYSGNRGRFCLARRNGTQRGPSLPFADRWLDPALRGDLPGRLQ